MYGNYFNNYQYQQNQNQDERIWVQNQNAAEAYLVAPNSFVRLWDSNRNVFYEKRADQSGRPFPLEVYEYKKCTTNKSDDLLNEIASIKERLERLEGGSNDSESNADDPTV